MYTVPLHLKLIPREILSGKKKKKKAMRETNASDSYRTDWSFIVKPFFHGFVFVFVISLSSGSSNGAPRHQPREASQFSPPWPLSLLSSSPRLRLPSGTYYEWGFEILKCNFPSNFLIDQTVFQGGDEQTRHDTDHIELFRYSLSPSYTHIFMYT